MPQSNGPPRRSSPATSPTHTDTSAHAAAGIASDGPSELRYHLTVPGEAGPRGYEHRRIKDDRNRASPLTSARGL